MSITNFNLNEGSRVKLMHESHLVYLRNREKLLNNPEIALLENSTFDHDHPLIYLIDILHAENKEIIAKKMGEIRPPYGTGELRIDPKNYLPWNSTSAIQIGEEEVFKRLNSRKNTKPYVKKLEDLLRVSTTQV